MSGRCKMSQQFSPSDSSEEDPASGASGTPLDPRAARDANAYSPYSSPMFLPAALPGYEMPDRSVPLPRFLQAKTTAMASATEAPAAGMKPEVQEDKPENVLNPGSIWHPDLCSRPCIYYGSGSCIHGAACSFCHLSHEKRAPHLDKRNRQTLKAISSDELYQIVMPEVAKKLSELSSHRPGLWRAVAPHLDFVIGSNFQSKADGRFRAVFRNMTVRQQLHLLSQKFQETDKINDANRVQAVMQAIEQQRSVWS
ncbi:unnamed protein product [Effrenium voratum]|nr:unnamed protein product [Effrenium voratum]|mmetsp:Transcript_133829/g.317196  ORF Transcript_133829/g.317196 Transcript_133829/m.317196 type:complete len:254 (+) Transcript_133829:77-838(+)